jgi:hypothetical protein
MIGATGAFCLRCRGLHDASNDVAWMEFVELYDKALFRYVRSKGLQDADAAKSCSKC